MNRFVFIFISIVALSCTTKDKYNVAGYYGVMEQDSILTGIITHIFSAPPYTSMKDRFQSRHRTYYSSLTSKFSIEKYFIGEDGTHYYFVLRPGSTPNEKRGVGGLFRMNRNFQLTGFREVFVTPVLQEKEAKEKGAFLFDEMVKGNISKYLQMPSYVQWPNVASEYDTTIFEWKLKRNAVE